MTASELKKTIVAATFGSIRGCHGLLPSKPPRHLRIFHRDPAFSRKAAAICETFHAHGVPTQLTSGLTYRSLLRLATSRELWMLFWAGMPPGLLPRRYIFYNTEPLENDNWGRSLDWLRGIGNAVEVWDYKANNCSRLDGLKSPVRLVPFGYSLYYEQVFSDNVAGRSLEQDIDVLFFGTLVPRRQKILEQFAKTDLRVQVIGRDRRVHGAELDRLIARSKIVLGVHAFDHRSAQIIDLARFDQLLSCGRFVLHEQFGEHGLGDQASPPHVPMFEPNDVVDVCRYYVGDDAVRLRWAEESRSWFKQTYPLYKVLPISTIKALLAEA